MPEIHVTSEISPLRRVIVHRPDSGISRLTPKRFEELLFDDIVHLEAMQREHDIFTSVLEAFIGEEGVIEVEDVLVATLSQDAEAKERMIHDLLDYEELPEKYAGLLLSLSDEELAAVLISGELASEDLVLFDPIPNFIFTRDIAITVNKHIIIAKAAKEARFRENFLMSYIFKTHSTFRRMSQEGRLIDLNDVEQFPPSRRGERVSVEGGDCMIFDNDFFLIGLSERTSRHGAMLLKDYLLENKIVKSVACVIIPKDRSFMHLDTIFTRISEEHVVCYKPIIIDGLSSYVEVFRLGEEVKTYPSVREFVLAEVNPEMKFITVGNGESPYQEREQWTDGSNLVVVKPGVGITYDRNIVTEKAFEKAGFHVIPAHQILRDIEQGNIRAEDVQKTIITIPSYELSRARGGSHCMTCPIERI